MVVTEDGDEMGDIWGLKCAEFAWRVCEWGMCCGGKILFPPYLDVVMGGMRQRIRLKYH